MGSLHPCENETYTSTQQQWVVLLHYLDKLVNYQIEYRFERSNGRNLSRITLSPFQF